MGRLQDATAAALAAVTASLPAGEDRPGQRDMAAAVAQAIETGGHLVVQAGTGTGKTIAYLVPAILAQRKVVVATATLALQDQLIHHDLPAVAAALKLPVRSAVLKGRTNYVCAQRVAESAEAGDQLDLPTESTGRAREEIGRIVFWAGITQSGDRADLSFEPSPAAWGALSVSSRDCPGATRCPSGGRCFAERARNEAAQADVLVVNTHLYGAHLASGGVVLADHDIVVIDEAHVLEDVIAATAGLEMTGGRFRSLRSAVAGIAATNKVESITRDLDGVSDRLRAWLAEHAGRGVSAPLPPELAGILLLGRGRVEAARAEVSSLPDNLPLEASGRKARALQAAGSLLTDIDVALAFAGKGDVAWVESGTNPTLRIAPIDVGPTLAEHLWSKRVVVLTSATIPTGVTKRLGLTGIDHRQLDVGSPFDYPNQALLYCASTLLDPRQPGYEAQLIEEIERLVIAARGRTLALFTSWRMMQTATAALRPRLPWRVFAQGDLPKGALLDAFSTDEQSCLFATASFWQGVDVPGPALSLVTIDRLPFLRPDDPLAQARRAAATNGFAAVDLPHAATMLAQAAGRLIRTRTDRGVVAVLDRRLATSRSYRWELINALPPMRRTKDRAEVLAFLRAIADDRERENSETKAVE